jgi:hypothetical protein
VVKRAVFGMGEECGHVLEFIGDQKAESGVNRYFKCIKCGDVFVVTAEEGKTYRIAGIKKE